MKRLLKRLAYAALNRGLVPSGRFRDRLARSYREVEIEREKLELFQGRRLRWSEAGYWHVDPMPSNDDLARYYRDSYWEGRSDWSSLLNSRDVGHFRMLEPYLKPLAGNPSSNRFLNFGAGHGGMSFLARAMGFEVTNVEPVAPDPSFPFSQHFSRYEEVVGQYDVIYGSHSLEHVQDVDAFLRWLDRSLKRPGYVFFEVPNCRSGKYPDRNVMSPPHTYYFTVEFFRNLPFRTVELGTYSYEASIAGEKEPGLEDGIVIRYLGARD